MPEEDAKVDDNPSVLRSIARKLRKNSDQDDGSILGSVLETGDKAKTEIVRMIAKEVRGSLEALEIHKDLKHILTNYSLEVKASINLKELIQDDEAEKADDSPTEADSEAKEIDS
jgi:hypothetical protein